VGWGAGGPEARDAQGEGGWRTKPKTELPGLGIGTTWLIPPVNSSMGLGDVKQKWVGGLGGLRPEMHKVGGLAHKTKNRAAWARYRYDLANSTR
jgi:hypothetical protein